MPTYLRFMAYLLPDTQGLQISGCNHNTEFSLKQTLDKKSQHDCVCRWMHIKLKKFHLLYGNDL